LLKFSRALPTELVELLTLLENAREEGTRQSSNGARVIIGENQL